MINFAFFLMFLSSLLESGVDGVGTEATDDLFFGALGDVESGVDGVGTEATDDVAFLVALICVDFLVGALGDVGFMIVLTAGFLRLVHFFCFWQFSWSSHGANLLL